MSVSSSSRFDLETALATWRRFHVHRRVFSTADLDELERHLRDHVADLLTEGLHPEAAFRTALTALGDIEGGEAEYRKVRGGKLRNEGRRWTTWRSQGALLHNHLKTAYRALLRQRGFSVINVVGLTLGMACCLLIAQYVAHEYSFDTFHEQHERLYRAVMHATTLDGTPVRTHGSTPYRFGPAVHEAVPDVVYARIQPNFGDAVFRYEAASGPRVFKETEVLYADSTFLDLFDFPVLAGTYTGAPGTVVLTASAAQRYFGDADAVGRQIQVTGWVRGAYTVVGVLAEVPTNSHLHFEALLPIADLLRLRRYADPARGWDRTNFATYFLLPSEADPGVVAEAMTAVYQRSRAQAHADSDRRVTLRLQPLLDIRLNADIQGSAADSRSRQTVLFFLVIGLITLALALLNYVNLATARVLDRMREVGVRKVVGARRGHLVGQFLTEAALLNVVAVLTAWVLAASLSPGLSALVGVKVEHAFWLQPSALTLVGGLFVAGTVLAGGYPALLLSSFPPLSLLRHRLGPRSGSAPLRRGLVLAQFTAATALLLGTGVVYQQIQYVRGHDTGFDLEQVLVIERPRVRQGPGAGWTAQMEALKQDVLRLPAVQGVGTSSTTPGRGFNWYNTAYRPENGRSSRQPVRATNIDHDFTAVYGLPLVAGKSFEVGMALSDEPGARTIVNETLVRAVGFPSNEAAVGADILDGRGDRYLIHGVVRDFAWSSAHQPAEAVMFLYETRYGDLSIRLRTEDLAATLATLKERFDHHFPGNPFTYVFADEAVDAQYRQDRQFGVLFGLFAGVALFIACLGLLGLSAYTAQRRIKEMGIRKTLGAPTEALVALLSKDLLRYVGLAFGLAVPLTWGLATEWLASYAVRTPLRPTLFLLIGGSVLLLAALTIGYHALRAARTRPAVSLRYE
ncbi:MAG: ABC transporter permease [Bacteroidota bacterium]